MAASPGQVREMKSLESQSAWLVAAENGLIPGGKVGGVGDVIRDLPLALAEQGWKISVITPAYGRLHRLPGAEKICRLAVRFGGELRYAEVWNINAPAGLNHPSVIITVIAHPLLDPLGDGLIYHADDHEHPYATDASKFAFFNAAVAALAETVPNPPEVLHLHDWHTGLLPALRAVARPDSVLARVRMIFTIHNLAYQGIRPFAGQASSLAAWFPQVHLPFDQLRDPRYPDCVNFMASAIRLADCLSTVSPSYVREILRPSEPEHGFMGGEGLEQDLQQAASQQRLFGILNGCNYDEVQNDRSGWDGLRSALQPYRLLARPADPGLHWLDSAAGPHHLLTSVGRLVEQKVALLLHPVGEYATALEAILAGLGRESLLILLGSGEPGLQTEIAAIAARHANLLFLCGYAEDLSKSLYCNGDLFLMPSSFEPCGISQMLAMRAGQPCVVHGVGGLLDTVIDGASGFVFAGDTPDAQATAFVTTVSKALQLRSCHKDAWQEICSMAAAQRFSWQLAARRYIDELYTARQEQEVSNAYRS